jgi:hypothetical protein
MKLGIAPPSPRPVRKRQAMSSPKLLAAAVKSVNRPKASVAPISTRLRPTRSAKGPSAKAPRANPASAALNTAPNAGGAI